jgi:predicted RNA methylase
VLQLVDVLLDKLNQQRQLSNHTTEGSTVDEKHLVILEPSCGHGRVVWTLMEHPSFDNLLQQYQTVTIIAIDLDPRAVEVCQKRVASDTFLQYKIAVPQQSVHFHCHDFLTTKREAFCQDVMGNANGRLIVAAVGGPPYGSKPEERSLPIHFVRHCVEEWKSTVIAFLVPKRFPQSLTRDDRDTNDDCMGAYTSQCLELENSTFYFHGTRAVTQPSRMQCWYQNDNLG